MFFVIKLKNFNKLFIVALLFVLLTAIIIKRVEYSSDAAETLSYAFNKTELIIDPGHGGLDGGASTADGVTESSINLAISLKMEALADLFGFRTVLTRDTDDLDYPDADSRIREKKLWDQKRRVELINSRENAVMISIHQNTYPDSRPKGIQVLYGFSEDSKLLGCHMHERLTELLEPDNRRVAAPVSEKIYLMKNIKCPAILVECGFLSNPEEAEMLKNSSYQAKLAMALVGAYSEFAFGQRENNI